MATVSDSLVVTRLAGTLHPAATGGTSVCREFLDDILRMLDESQADPQPVRRAMEDLFEHLYRLRAESDAREWQSRVAEVRKHRLLEMIHQDPFTWRAYSKPRGYAGDAVLLDYIYGREEHWPVPEATALGRQIFDYTTQAPACEGVRARRGVVAEIIDRLCEERRGVSILSIAAGHLREAALSAAVKRRRFGRFVALDSDKLSLATLESDYGRWGVEAVAAHVRRLIAGKVALGQFDLVYSTGLFDYVGPAAGRRLVSVMFRLLRPGGKLLVANFLPGIRDAGFMEAFMDWYLIYRDRQEMIDLTTEVPQREIGEIVIRAEEHQNIIFVQVSRV